VANITITELDGRSAADIMHAQTSALGGETTVAEARAYFAASSSRRLAVLADDGLYRGALTPADLPETPIRAGGRSRSPGRGRPSGRTRRPRWRATSCWPARPAGSRSSTPAAASWASSR
jgi:hypothetical protein